MTLQDRLSAVLNQVTESSVEITPQQLISLIDYTCLNEHARENDIYALAAKATQYHVAAICIYPQHLKLIPNSFPLHCATVVNFPTGDSPLSQVLTTIDQIKSQYFVHEIDYVFPYHTYLSGDKTLALSHCHSVYSHCKQQGLIFKVILETGAFPSLEMIHELSLSIIDAGCDFLKTSTGKISQGATIEAVFAILTAIHESQSACGIKISGGVKTIEQAMDYIRLASFILNKPPHQSWVRIGASQLLDACIQSLNLK